MVQLKSFKYIEQEQQQQQQQQESAPSTTAQSSDEARHNEDEDDIMDNKLIKTTTSSPALVGADDTYDVDVVVDLAAAGDIRHQQSMINTKTSAKLNTTKTEPEAVAVTAETSSKSFQATNQTNSISSSPGPSSPNSHPATTLSGDIEFVPASSLSTRSASFDSTIVGGNLTNASTSSLSTTNSGEQETVEGSKQRQRQQVKQSEQTNKMNHTAIATTTAINMPRKIAETAAAAAAAASSTLDSEETRLDQSAGDGDAGDSSAGTSPTNDESALEQSTTSGISGSSISSNEEYQSAVHDMNTDASTTTSRSTSNSVIMLMKSSTNLEQGRLEDIARERAARVTTQQVSSVGVPAGGGDNVTRISIEKGSISSLVEPSEQIFSSPRLKLTTAAAGAASDAAGTGGPGNGSKKMIMTRSQTSPCSLSQLASATSGSQKFPGSPLITSGLNRYQQQQQQQQQAMFNANMSPATMKRTATSPDNMSQFSFSTQKNYQNHFEIRWQNVRLYARKSNSLMPKFITDSVLYQRNFATKSDSDNASINGAQVCYSPPLQHKIPPTINEEPLSNSGKPLSISENKLQSAMSQLPSSSSSSSPEGRCILNNISGQVFSGQMTAILGPSGVGKTTLLNSLTGRNTLDGTGRVSLIGATTRKRMSVVTVPQMDVLPGKLTTMEDLLYTSRLKNPMRKFNHRKNIERIVKHLHMEKFLHTRIDKLSGGEERRLSIARELLASPDIMILDEPTSGLDANTCKKIITALRDIVEHSDHILDKPMSIIVTIHQPQQEVYNLFHRIYVMAIGGRVVYEGPPSMLLPTIVEQSSLAKVTPVDQLNENPAIVAIEVASGEFGPQIIDELAHNHEDQVYEEFSILGNSFAQFCDTENGNAGMTTPKQTPRTPRMLPRKSPLSVSRFEMYHKQQQPSTQPHRKRLNSWGDGSIGRPTPIMAKRQFNVNQMDRMSSMTSLSYASTYDAELPEVTSKLKVDKRLRRSVVMKSHLFSHTWTLMQRCWLLNTRDMFLMCIRVLGFLLVAAGTVQIFADSLDPNEHQCPQYITEVDNVIEYITDVKDRLLNLESMYRQSSSVHMFFFHILLCITMVTSALTGLVFPLQMRMFIREYKNGWYSPASFILSQTLAELPVDIIGPLITLLITYPLCNQPVSQYYWREIGYALVIISCSIICKSQAQIVGAFLMDSVENSVFISCVCVTGPALLSGIPVRVSQMIYPMQLASYGSFLRYGFESLLALRYGYGMCPCDPELVNGYPIGTSPRAVPTQLATFTRGIIELNQPINQIANSLTSTADSLADIDREHENIILKFIRLVTDAGNQMVTNAHELGDCDRYRSLYLLSMDIPNGIVSKWLAIMALMFVVSRILTYFVVKTVIKLRPS